MKIICGCNRNPEVCKNTLTFDESSKYGRLLRIDFFSQPGTRAMFADRDSAIKMRDWLSDWIKQDGEV